MTATELSAIAGVVLSLFFSYVPGVKSWFGDLSSEYKQTVMGLLLLGGVTCSTNVKYRQEMIL